MRRTSVPILTGICTSLVLTACATSAASQPTASPTPTAASPTAVSPTTPTPTPTPAPTPSPSPTAWQSFPPADPTETEDQTAIREGWEEYQRQVDKYSKDLSIQGLTPLTLTTTGQAATSIVEYVADIRERGHVREGNMSFRDLQVGVPTTSSDGTRIVEASVCADFSNVQTVFADSKKPVPAHDGSEWVETLRVTYTMVEQPNGRWVISDSYAEKETC